MAKTPSILDHYPEYELNIGIEVHVQLTTKTKIFCSCSNAVAKEPNSTICQICAGYPGVLPVLNKQVVEFAIMTGLGTHCTIAPVSEFARKHYFYPDLPKGYQTTQHTDPICKEGYINIRLEDGSKKKIRLIRIHMEEDAGKNIHAEHTNESFVDLSRAGTPLLEVVSYPDISSTYEARAYLKALRSIVTSLGVCTGNMEEGAFRADTNVSVRKKGAKELGTRAELKNINSFKFIGDAVEYEIERQIELIEAGGTVKQETRLWNTQEHKSYAMRSKEEAADYRYFPDPDLPLIEINEDWIKRVKDQMPELPEEKFERYVSTLGLSEYEAGIIVEDRELANYFEQAHALNPSRQVVNWMLRDLLKLAKDQNISVSESKVTPEKLARLVKLIDTGVINNHAALQVFEEIATSGGNPEEIVKAKGLEQIGSVEELEAIIKEIIASHPNQVAAYKAGTTKMFGFFVGQAMAKTQGKGNPQVIQQLLKKYLE